MEYPVTLTPLATEQLHQAVLYIAHTRQAPQTAKRWADLLCREITGPSFMPSRYPLTDEEPWRANGIHRMPVKSFLVYCLIDEENRPVSVTAVNYGRRDQLAALAETAQDRV